MHFTTRRRTIFLVGAIFVAAALALYCFNPAEVPYLPDMSRRQPTADPMTTAAIDLGRRLFYDRRLSGNSSIACATCHYQSKGFSDGRATPTGSTGKPLHRNAPGLFNSTELATLNWADPRLTSLEQQIVQPLFATNPPEMGAAGYEQAILMRLREDSTYPPLFAAAFPDDSAPVRWPRIVEALAAFTRSLSARNSPYDRFTYQGDQEALTPSAQRGMALFFSPGLACGHCHVDIVPPEQATPPRWGDLAYLSNGAGRSPDRGLARQSGRPEDAYRFRVPPLRNVAVTEPYMHDGSLPTLAAVIRFYESGGRLGAGLEPERTAARHPLVAGFSLSDAERRDLITFLEALTDMDALTDPRYSDPSIQGGRDARVPRTLYGFDVKRGEHEGQPLVKTPFS